MKNNAVFRNKKECKPVVMSTLIIITDVHVIGIGSTIAHQCLLVLPSRKRGEKYETNEDKEGNNTLYEDPLPICEKVMRKIDYYGIHVTDENEKSIEEHKVVEPYSTFPLIHNQPEVLPLT